MRSTLLARVRGCSGYDTAKKRRKQVNIHISFEREKTWLKRQNYKFCWSLWPSLRIWNLISNESLVCDCAHSSHFKNHLWSDDIAAHRNQMHRNWAHPRSHSRFYRGKSIINGIKTKTLCRNLPLNTNSKINSRNLKSNTKDASQFNSNTHISGHYYGYQFITTWKENQ